jgi:hypothetical protein
MHERSCFAVCISLDKIANGQLRLVLDDVERDGTDPLRWRLSAFVTVAAMTTSDLAQMRFTDQQLADFGGLVLGAVAVHMTSS